MEPEMTLVYLSGSHFTVFLPCDAL